MRIITASYNVWRRSCLLTSERCVEAERGLDNMKFITLRVTTAVVMLACVTSASATPILSFLIDGNTFTQPFSITNSSDAGELVTRFQLDISPPSMVFDTAAGGPPGNGTAGVPFTPVGGTDGITGLVGPVVVADGTSLLDISFTDFDPTETFSWDIDVDGASGSPITVNGDDLIGSLATVDFSNGQRLFGSLVAVPGNSDASTFTVTGVGTIAVPEPNTLALLVFGIAGMWYGQRRKSP